MLVARFGGDFVGRIEGNLEVKTQEVQRRDNRAQGKKRGDKKERAPR